MRRLLYCYSRKNTPSRGSTRQGTASYGAQHTSTLFSTYDINRPDRANVHSRHNKNSKSNRKKACNQWHTKRLMRTLPTMTRSKSYNPNPQDPVEECWDSSPWSSQTSIIQRQGAQHRRPRPGRWLRRTHSPVVADLPDDHDDDDAPVTIWVQVHTPSRKGWLLRSAQTRLCPLCIM